MINKEHVVKGLKSCSQRDKKCSECPYRRWVRDVCQTHLCRDALKMINEQPSPKLEFEQIEFDI